MKEYSIISRRFDLIPIKFGDEEISCRPIEWDSENVPIKYMTTCPKCAQLIEFMIEDVCEDRYYCPNCENGKKEYAVCMDESDDDDMDIDEIVEEQENDILSYLNEESNFIISGYEFTVQQKKLIQSTLNEIMDIIDE